ncbi:hypothetical protein C3E94_27735, partial [Klebsiella pneumoniae]
LNDNALAFDDFMNSESDTFIDRFGDPKDSLPGTTKKIMLAADDVIEATRQNLIPLSRQYMTLADAQADIANIPFWESYATKIQYRNSRPLQTA